MDGATLWCGGFALYIVDSMRSGGSGVVLRYALDRVDAGLRTPSIRIAGWEILVPNPLRPDICELPATMTTTNPRSLNTVDRHLIEGLRSLYMPHQIAASGSFVSLFVLTPVLGAQMSLLRSLVFALVLSNLFLIGHWIRLVKNRALLGATWQSVASDMVHSLLCPPNGPNCARRMIRNRHLRYDGMQVLWTYARLDAIRLSETGL